jgi:hypothetical protein
MVPLAITSTAGWIRRLGGRNWQRLHRLVYVSAAAGVVHYWWLVKSDIREPAAYALTLAILLGLRKVVRPCRLTHFSYFCLAMIRSSLIMVARNDLLVATHSCPDTDGP